MKTVHVGVWWALPGDYHERVGVWWPLQGDYRGHAGAQGVMHDSDNIIPPSNGGPPRSYVPYLSIARAGRMQQEGSQEPGSPGKVFKGDQVSQQN